MAQRSSAKNADRGQDDLDVILRDRPKDEKNGADATLGFTFEQWWAALVIAERLEGGEDFAVGVEVKEDVAILDSSQAPTKVEFCQIKKREQEGLWAFKDSRPLPR